MHAYPYNACVEHRKTSWRHHRQSVDYFDQQAALVPFKDCWPEYKSLNHGSSQATVKRVDFAFQRLFRGLSKRTRFRSIRLYSGWTYPDARQGFKVLSDGRNGYLKLNDLDVCLKMRGKARQWGRVTTCTIVYRHGCWYASFSLKSEAVTRETGTGAIGIDLGCKDAVTFSDGTKEQKPEFIKAGDRKVKAAGKALRRKRAPHRTKRVKASARWKRARKAMSAAQRKVANQRKQWLHQLSSDIVSRSSLVAGEELAVKNMTRKAKKGSKRKRQKAGLNRSILSVGFGMFSNMLAYKLAEAGGFYIESPTEKLKPTQRCAECWELTPKTLGDRVHVCQHCGHTDGRDVNAARVNLIWARGQELSSLNVEKASSRACPRFRGDLENGGSTTDCGSMRQLASRKRKKPLAQPQAASV